MPEELELVFQQCIEADKITFGMQFSQTEDNSHRNGIPTKS